MEECPECLRRVHSDELDAFGGLCEECSAIEDERYFADLEDNEIL